MNDLDADIWDRVLKGDAAALGALFARHSARVFAHAVRHVSVREDAKDAVIIAFYELWRRRAHVRLVDGSPLPWLLNTVTNTARNVERSSRRYRRVLEAAGWEHRVITVDETPTDPAVNAALDRLTARERSVVVLTLIEGYSERDTASALGIPVGTVKSRLSRAKQRLRGELAHLKEA